MAAGLAMPVPVIRAKHAEHLNDKVYCTVVPVRDCVAEDGEEPELGAVLSKVSRWVMPICFLAGILSYLESTNLNFAALQLNGGLGFAPQDYGLGAGLFFLGYGLGHVPSTFVTMRCGARWYSSLVIAWGVVATCGALIRSSTGLCLQRFALGLAEAGAIPSALHLMSQFYPVHMRSKPFLAVTLANVVSVVFAGPLAAGIMTLDGRGGLRGWQWLFIIEGVPSVLLGAVMMVLLPSGPLSAWMLTPKERHFLHKKVHDGDAEAAKQQLQWKQMITLTAEALRMPQLWFFSISAFLWVLGIFSLNAWMPIIIKNMLAGTALQASSSSGGSSTSNTLHATLLAKIPYFCAAIAMWLNTWSAVRLGERMLHVGVPCVFGGILLALFEPLYRAAFAAGFAALAIAIACAYCGQSSMFARVTESLDTRHAGVGIAIFNAIGAALGGFSGPWIVGTLVHRMGSFVPSMVFMGAFLTASGVMLSSFGVWEFRHRRQQQQQQQQQDLKQQEQLQHFSLVVKDASVSDA